MLIRVLGVNYIDKLFSNGSVGGVSYLYDASLIAFMWKVHKWVRYQMEAFRETNMSFLIAIRNYKGNVYV